MNRVPHSTDLVLISSSILPLGKLESVLLFCPLAYTFDESRSVAVLDCVWNTCVDLLLATKSG